MNAPHRARPASASSPASVSLVAPQRPGRRRTRPVRADDHRIGRGHRPRRRRRRAHHDRRHAGRAGRRGRGRGRRRDRVAIEHPNAFQLRVRLAHAGDHRHPAAPGRPTAASRSGPLTWDDEASAGLRTGLAGRHLPPRPAARRARRHHAGRRVAAARSTTGPGSAAGCSRGRCASPTRCATPTATASRTTPTTATPWPTPTRPTSTATASATRATATPTGTAYPRSADNCPQVANATPGQQRRRRARRRLRRGRRRRRARRRERRVPAGVRRHLVRLSAVATRVRLAQGEVAPGGPGALRPRRLRRPASGRP